MKEEKAMDHRTTEPAKAVIVHPAVPVRVHRKRTAGWRMPPNTVSVARPGKWGNPFFIINEEGSPWITDARDPSMPVLNYDVQRLLNIAETEPLGWRNARRGVVELFRQQCCDRSFAELRGKNLACWCPLDQPCHADIILQFANSARQ